MIRRAPRIRQTPRNQTPKNQTPNNQTHGVHQTPMPPTSVRSIDRIAKAHDASHYYLVPASVVTPNTTTDVQALFREAHAGAGSLTFRSGGTSLSGQGVTDGVLADPRSAFRRIEVLENGSLLRMQPGATVRAGQRRTGEIGTSRSTDATCALGHSFRQCALCVASLALKAAHGAHG